MHRLVWRLGLALLLLVATAGRRARAEELKRMDVVLPTVATEAPAEALILLQFNTDTFELSAAHFLRSAVAGQVGAVVYVPAQAATSSAGAVLRFENGQVEVVPMREIPLDLNDSSKWSADGARNALIQMKTVLEKVEIQSVAQAGSVQRLRRDVDTIGGEGRIRDLTEEIDKLKGRQTSAASQREALEAAMQVAARAPTPRNARLREGELTRQLTELVTVTQQTEAQELSRRADSEADLQRTVSAIDTTKWDDPAVLTQQLASLRAEREQLEQSLGIRAEEL